MKEYTSCFVGIPLPQEYQSEFGDLLKGVNEIDASLETVDPKTPHITVYYLDTQSRTVLSEIAGAVKNHVPVLSDVRLQVGKLGFFRPGNPRVIFLDVKYPEVLSTFNEFITSDLVSFFADDNNLPFHPHMTVARMGTETAQMSFARKKQELEEKLSGISWNFPITEVVLYGVDSTKGPKFHKRIITIPVER